MKKSLSLFVSSLLIILTVACKKDNEVDPGPEPAPINEAGQITPVGTPTGEAITASIGPAGGSIESADKRIRVDIPAGALTSPQTISIQPITNNCPSGKGEAFRLTPHGLQFAKPATITFQYTESDLEGTFAEGLAIAWQAEKGEWKSTFSNHVDTLSKQLSVQTTHFSDWSFFKSVFIDPKQAYIEPGQQVKLGVYQHLSDKQIEGELSVPYAKPVDAKNIKNWTLNGTGTLKPDVSDNYEAVYTAPGYVPADNPVTVSVNIALSNGQKHKFSVPIYIAPEGLIYRINGGRWISTISPLGAYSVDSPGRGTFITFKTGNKAGSQFSDVQLIWKADRNGKMYADYTIEMPWELDKKNINAPQFLLSESPTGHPFYAYYYEQGRVVYPSPGSFTFQKVTSVANQNYVYGKFLLEKSGIVESSTITDPFIGTAKIEGIFRVKLNN